MGVGDYFLRVVELKVMHCMLEVVLCMPLGLEVMRMSKFVLCVSHVVESLYSMCLRLYTARFGRWRMLEDAEGV